MYGKVGICWLNLNRNCNLNCSWCYAKNAGNQEVSVYDACRIIDFLVELKVNHLTLIGGEPTVYKDLDKVLRHAHKNNINVGIVTNGIRLSDKSYLEYLLSCGLKDVGLSLKGYNQDNFKKTTGVNSYSNVLKGIQNLKDLNVPFSVSFVIAKDDIKHISSGIKDARSHGAESFNFGFCADFEACRTDKISIENPFLLAEEFEKYYQDIDLASNGRFVLHQTLPLCVWNKEIIETLSTKHQIRSSCQLLKKNGLIFNTDLSIIPCNSMYDYRIGKFGEDFSDATSFLEFWNSDKVMNFYSKLAALPDIECKTCEGWKLCGGGCVANWFNYNFDMLKKQKQDLPTSSNVTYIDYLNTKS